MTGYEFGDLVLVPFPFTDQSTIKQTPPRRGDQQCRLPSSATRPPDHGHYKSTTLHTVRGRDPDPGLARRRVAQAIRPQTDPRHHRPSPRAQEARTTNPDRSSRSSTDDQHHSRVGPPHPASFLAHVLRVSHAYQPHTPSVILPAPFFSQQLMISKCLSGHIADEKSASSRLTPCCRSTAIQSWLPSRGHWLTCFRGLMPGRLSRGSVAGRNQNVGGTVVGPTPEKIEI